MFEKLGLVYEKARHTYLQGDQEALKVMKQTQTVFEFCHCFQNAKLTEDEIEELEKPERK